jgi:hypothetical protein
MNLLLGMVGLMLSHVHGGPDSIQAFETTEAEVNIPSLSLLHVVASTYGSLGWYSTGTQSQSASAYVTMNKAWQDFYTLGFSSLWLNSDDAGGNYYQQQLLSARASWLFAYRVNLSVHYGFLNEGEIQGYSSASRVHFFGGGAHYWFSPIAVAGGSFTLSLSEGTVQSNSTSGSIAFYLGGGVWSTTMMTTGKATWSQRLFVARQTVSVSFEGENVIEATADVGRRVFHFDDQLLVAYNQRDIQTGHYLLKGVVQLTSQLFVVPSFEYNTFDDYNVRYASVGLRFRL